MRLLFSSMIFLSSRKILLFWISSCSSFNFSSKSLVSGTSMPLSILLCNSDSYFLRLTSSASDSMNGWIYGSSGISLYNLLALISSICTLYLKTVSLTSLISFCLLSIAVFISSPFALLFSFLAAISALKSAVICSFLASISSVSKGR